MRAARFWSLSVATAVAAMLCSASLPGGSADAQKSYKDYVCMTDEGYGRYRPCSANFKARNPNWRATDNCFTDEGYGRYRPCTPPSCGSKALLLPIRFLVLRT